MPTELIGEVRAPGATREWIRAEAKRLQLKWSLGPSSRPQLSQASVTQQPCFSSRA